MAKITANNSITVAAGSTITFCEGGIGQAILDGNIYTLGMSDVFLGPFASAETIQVLVTSGPINYYTVAAPAAGANMTPLFVDPLTGYTTPRSGAVFMPPAATSDAINAAGALAEASGGGVVYIPPTRITMTGPIQMRSGVRFEGAVNKYAFAGIADAASITFVGGSVLVGNGTFNAFEYNHTDLSAGTPLGTSDAFSDAALSGGGIKGVCIESCLNGVKIGGLANPGAFWCQFEDIFVKGCAEWGVWFENFFHSRFTNINVFGCTVGQQAYVGSAATLLNSGNSIAVDLFSITPAAGNNSRGLVVWSRNNSISGIDLHKVQCNRSGTPVTQAATMTNGSENIGVVDGTKFPVQMPVVFSAAANGFNAGQVYFVKSVVGNTITLADNYYGAAKLATGNTAVNIITHGFPAFEAAGQTASDSVGTAVTGCDFEGQATTLVLLQNIMSQSGTNDFQGVIETAQSKMEVTIRNCGSGMAVMHFGRVDQDSSSRHQIGGTISGFVNAKPKGMYRNANTARWELNLAENWASSFTHNPGPTIVTKTVGGGDFTYPGISLGQKCATFGNTTLGLSTAYAGAVLFSGAANGVWTLPAVETEMVGLKFDLTNGGADGTTLTVNTSSGQLFNNQAGRTSIVLDKGEFLQVIAQNNGGGAFIWQVLSTNGT